MKGARLLSSELLQLKPAVSVLLAGLLIVTQAGFGQGVTGTGFIVDANGYLLTCEHVVHGAGKVEVVIGENTYQAAVIATDEKRDLALIEIKAKELPALPLGNSNAVEVGEDVRAFGFPLASVLGDSVKVTSGLISGIEIKEVQKVFQIDASVNPGNSGGPLVNEKGEVVGVINAKLVGAMVSNVGFAVPINYAKQMLHDNGVEFASEGAKVKWDGPALVKKVSPAVALIRGTQNTLNLVRPPKDVAPMVLIPAGEFEMGTDAAEIPGLVAWTKRWYSDAYAGWFEDETPRHTVYLDAFYIDVYEVTNAQYRKFVQATGHPDPKGDGIVDGVVTNSFEPWKDSRFNAPDSPVFCVSWYDAAAYAQWVGKRLPTEAEWEKAARGGLVGKRFPWGNDDPDETKANYDNVGEPTPVDQYPPNGYGLYDMAGNVAEWCLDEYDSGFYAKGPKNNPVAGGVIEFVNNDFTNVETVRVLRGGSRSSPQNRVRVADRQYRRPTDRNGFVGFRCARNVTP